MDIVFFGTPEYVLSVVNQLHREFKPKVGESPIVAVVTQPPKESGRKKYLSYSAVDAWAHKRKIPVFYDQQEFLNQKLNADIGILASYGVIVTQEMLDYFPLGILNIHPSLLPQFRGASPVQAALVSGATETGSTIMKLDPLLDHGPIVSQFVEEIKEDDTTPTLRERLFNRTANELISLLPSYAKGKINLKEQNHEKATFTRQIKKDHAYVDPEALAAALEGKTLEKDWEIKFMKDFTTNYSPTAIHNFIRAMQPWPVAWTKVQLSTQSKAQSAKRLLLHKAYIENRKLILDEVQLEGKAKVSWKQFSEGYANYYFGHQT